MSRPTKDPHSILQDYNKYWQRIVDMINSADPSKINLSDLWAAITYSEIIESKSAVCSMPNYSTMLKQGPRPYFTSSLEEFCSIKKNLLIEDEIEESELIVDLGSGWGRNSTFLAEKYPDKTILSLEYTRAGIQATKLIAEKYELENIVTSLFDYHNPAALDNVVFPLAKTVDNVYFFSSYSIEQIPYLGENFILKILNSPFKKLTCLHVEPIGWQVRGTTKNTNHNYNNDLFSILVKLETNDLINIKKVEVDVFWLQNKSWN